jgi:hypothetical protein
MGINPRSDVNVAVYYGENSKYLASDCEISLSHKNIDCITVAGVGKDHNLVVKVGNQTSEAYTNQTLNYGPPIITSYEGEGADDASTTGKQEVILHGNNFGTGTRGQNLDITFSNENYPNNVYRAENCTMLTNHTKIRCKTVQHAGASLVWRVTVGGQVSKIATTNAAAPVITSVKLLNGNTTMSTYGDERIEIRGENFGPAKSWLEDNNKSIGFLNGSNDFLEYIHYGRTKYEATNCNVTNHSTVECMTSPGIGTDLQFTARVQGQVSDRSERKISYSPPYVKEYSRTSGSTDGTTRITVKGWHFGLNVPGSILQLEFDGNEEKIDPILTRKGKYPDEHDSFDFLVPIGMGRNKILKVLVGLNGLAAESQASDPVVFNYLKPEIDSLTTSRWEGKKRLFKVAD